MRRVFLLLTSGLIGPKTMILMTPPALCILSVVQPLTLLMSAEFSSIFTTPYARDYGHRSTALSADPTRAVALGNSSRGRTPFLAIRLTGFRSEREEIPDSLRGCVAQTRRWTAVCRRPR